MKYALPIVAIFAWVVPALAAPFSEPSRLEKPQAGFYRLKIGKVDVIAVNDGAASFDVLGVLAKAKRETAAKIMAKSYVKSPVEASVNAYIILLGGRTILVDAGTGELFGAKLGKLPDSLRAAGVTPESITDVLLTHIHPDHSGGLTVGGNKIFPNATIHVNKKELDFWSDKSTRGKYPEPTKTYFGQVATTLGPYIASGQVKTFEGGIQIFPGIRSLPAYGHTPGHTYYVLEDGEKLVFWGDTIHAPDAQFEMGQEQTSTRCEHWHRSGWTQIDRRTHHRTHRHTATMFQGACQARQSIVSRNPHPAEVRASTQPGLAAAFRATSARSQRR